MTLTTYAITGDYVGYFRIGLAYLLCLSCFVLQAKGVQKVIILADDGYPPYSFVENGQLKGIYVELVQEAAKKVQQKYHIELIATPWKRALMKIEDGNELAILPPYKHLKERPYMWPYSVALMNETVSAFCHKSVDIKAYLNTFDQLQSPPLNIGINAGYIMFTEDILAAISRGNIVVWENKSTDANIIKLHSKRVDCYLNDRLSILWEFEKLQRQQKLSFSEIEEVLSVMNQTAHIGYSNSNNEAYPYKDEFVKSFDKSLMQIKSSPKYHQIIRRYIKQTH